MRRRHSVACQVRRFLDIKGTRTVDSFHRELGKMLWDNCGMSRTAEGLKEALGKIPETARAVLERREGAGTGES